MKNLILARLFALLFVVASLSLVQSQAQSVYHVRAGATGANNGSDWNNAFTTLPSSLVRGATYYIADGAYGSYTFDDATSGTTLTTIKKATITDHGTNTSWSDAYGDGSADFTSWTFESSYWLIDGQVGQWAPDIPDYMPYGIRVRGQGGDHSKLIRIGKSGDGKSNITIKHVEAGFTNTPRTGSWGKSMDLIFSYGSLQTISYCWLHDAGRVINLWVNTDDVTVEYSVLERSGHAQVAEGYSPSEHSELVMMQPDADRITYRYNYLRDWRSTGGLIHYTENNDIKIYGNIFQDTGYYTVPDEANDSNGAINGLGAGTGYSSVAYNNTFVNLRYGASLYTQGSFSSAVAMNNLFYNCHRYSNGANSGVVIRGSYDYNWFYDSGTQTEANLQNGSSGAFVNLGGKDFRLAVDTLPGNTSVPALYRTDMFGRTGTSRGAFQFADVAPDTTAPTLSNTSASSLSSSGAVIAWTTDEPASSTVEYGTTTAYGSTATSSSLLLAHSVVVSDLTADTVYHYRVVSRDLAGNTATSGDFTFRTGVPDTTPPAIALTSPLPGAILSNQASFQANATDNVGGSGVEEVAFYVDGELVGEAVTADSTNYSLSWDTTTVANGTYSVQAVARDAEGNEAASAAINVTVENTLPDLTDGLLGYWTLDETSGMVASDSSGNGNHGVVMRESGWTTGRLKGARAFSGAAADYYVDLGPINVTGDQLTLAAWVKPFSFGHDPRVMAKSEGIDSGQMYWLLEIDDGSPHQVGFRVNAGGSEVRLTGGTVEAGQWIHVVGAYDGTRMRLYMNGVEVANQAKTGSLRSGSAPAWIGNNPPDGQRPFDGVIDDVRIYNRALTSADIAELQKKTNPNPPAGIELLGN